MILQALYFILAALGLGLLVFLHELAHYFMARHVGMKVEAFSIGFGRSLISWKHQGVVWKLGWLPFGGYVKIAGMQKEKGIEPHDIPGGYFSKKPIDRIKVAIIAPIVNLVIAFLFFSIIWFLGGREKPFHDFTHRIGSVDPQSELYQKGIGPGDEITSYNDRKFRSFKDLFQGVMISGGNLRLKGYTFDYLQGKKIPFDIETSPYQHPEFAQKGILTSGIIAPANYILYNPLSNGQENPILPGSPLYQSGITYGDQIIWLDGELIFSNMQLNELLNSNYSLVTVDRKGQTFLAKVSRLQIHDLKINPQYREELGDLKYEQNLKEPLKNLYTLPYQFSPSLVVEAPLSLYDGDQSNQLKKKISAIVVETSLQTGDKVLALDGHPVSNLKELFGALQTHKFNIIAQSGNEHLSVAPWQIANANFEKNIHWQDLTQIMNALGTQHPIQNAGRLKLLKPVTPEPLTQIAEISQNSALQKGLAEQQNKINELGDTEKREQAQITFDKAKKRLFLGANFQDRLVSFNPPPYLLFAQVTGDVWHTLKALITGSLNPKWLSGPVGIVQVMHQGWSLGIKEAIYWLGLISLNLGFLNLLPIPALDGGHICFSLWEIITKKPLKSKTMERIVLPFVILLIGLFIFVTFHDLSRLIKGVL
jgi:regulator of sigma E protease